MESLGYTSIRMWYQPLPAIVQDFEEYFLAVFGIPNNAAVMKSLSEEKALEVKEYARQLFDETLSDKHLDPKNVEIMIIHARK